MTAPRDPRKPTPKTTDRPRHSVRGEYLAGNETPTSPAANETAVLGTVLDNPSCAMKANLARILRAAPESFQDLRLGVVAAAARDCPNPDLPSVAKALGPRLEEVGGYGFLLSLVGAALPPDLADVEAERLFKAFEARRVKRILAEATESLDQHPDKAAEVAFGVSAALDLDGPGRVTLGDILESRKFDFSNRPAEDVPLYTLAGVPVATLGNIQTITSAVKAGKSAIIGALAASTMSSGRDCLGFASSNPTGAAVLWFDSEQSPGDFWLCVERAIRRAGLNSPPPWLAAYCLTGIAPPDNWQCVLEALRRAKHRFGKIHSVLLDGAADFVADVNDPAESNKFVAELQGLAIEHACAVWTVIHFNPGGEKSRGHLGSQLERKAETNLALSKEDGVTLIWSEKQRRGCIPKTEGPLFAWSDEAAMHVSIDRSETPKARAQRDALRQEAEAAFSGSGKASLRFTELVHFLVDLGGVSRTTAKRHLDQMLALGIVKKQALGYYGLVSS